MHAAGGRSNSGAVSGGSRGNGGTAGDTTATREGAAGGGLVGYGGGRLSNGSHSSFFLSPVFPLLQNSHFFLV